LRLALCSIPIMSNEFPLLLCHIKAQLLGEHQEKIYPVTTTNTACRLTRNVITDTV